MLNEQFKDYRKKRIDFDMAKDNLKKEIRKAKQEIIAGELKVKIIGEMLKAGDISTMSSMPEVFFTESTESDTKYGFLAEAAVLAANYFKDQGFEVDVRWTEDEGAHNKRRSKAGIYFTF